MGSKFCPECGTPFAGDGARVGEERKVVSALFCDLVGFTAASEGADPEDVERMLAPYAARRGPRSRGTAGWWRSSSAMRWWACSACRSRMRTIPSALCGRGCGSWRTRRSCEAVGDAPLRMRVGVNTGEAVVRRGRTRGWVRGCWPAMR